MPLRILVLLDNPFIRDQRVHREVTSLARAGHEVRLLATGGFGLPRYESFERVELRREIPTNTLKLRDGGAVSRLGECLAGEDFDVIHCHDHLMLRVGAEVKRRRKDVCLIYDSHELLHGWPLNLDTSTSWMLRIKSHLARRIGVRREAREARLADFVITVNDSLADDLKAHFARRERPLVLRNAPRLVPLPLRTQRLRDRLSIPSEQRILVYIRSRLHTRTQNLERVLDEFRTRTDVALVFISGQPLAGNEVVAYARQRGCVNAYFHEAIPPAEVIATLASADVGLVPIWNRRDLSYWYALDNKVFDYVAAGLPLLATAQPEYKRVVEEYGVGVCVNPDERDAYVRGFDAVVAGEARFREAALGARERLCWEKEEPRLLALYQEVARRRARSTRGRAALG
jgi:glycosyltransferase involved in cell wall biosynthesis